MRELSKQEAESVSGGTAGVITNWVPVEPSVNPFHALHYERLLPKIVMPNINVVEDIFKNSPDS